MRFPSLILIAASVALLPRGASADPCGEKLPPSLAVPAGHELAFALDAEGVQIYACTVSGGSHAWVFQAPEAQLSETSAPAGKHYAGPTWEATDGSKVVGAKVDGVTPDAAAIPWLLLRASSKAGSGRMAEVTYVQRIKTSGGNAPSGGCDADHAGAATRVPYRAVYCFYRAVAAK
jgi:hypothetical protein